MHGLECLAKHSIDESNFDAIRLPQDDQRPGCNKGYAFVNCTSSEAVLHFWIKWHSKGWHEMYPNCQKKCQLAFAQHQLPARKSIQGVTVQACHSETQKSAGFPVRVQKSAAPSHEHPQSAVQSDQPTSKLSSACAIDLRAPDLQYIYDQHHDEEDYDERTENVHTVRARSTDGAQKESRRARRMRRLQAQQQAEAACGDLTKGADSSTTKCVSVDGKGRARTVVVGADVSGGDRGDDGGGDGGDDGGGEGGEDDGGQGSSDGDGAVHRWLRQTETAEAAPADRRSVAEILHAREQQAIDSATRQRESFRAAIHAMQNSTLSIVQATELAVIHPSQINTAVAFAILAPRVAMSFDQVKMATELDWRCKSLSCSDTKVIAYLIASGALASLKRLKVDDVEHPALRAACEARGIDL